MLGALLRIPATATVHDHPDNLTNGPMRRRIMRASMRRLDGVVYVSRAVAEAWQGVRRLRRASTIHNGLADHRSRRSPAGTPRIGFLGMNGPRKGFDIVSAWASRPSAIRAQWKFYGDTHQSLTAAAARLREVAGDAVVFPGRRPTTDIFDEIDILVHASTEFDSFPTVLLEAARAGVPAIAATVGGAAEIVVNGETGYLFEPRNPDEGFERLAALLASSDCRENIGRAARARYERQFTVAEMTRRYAEFWSADSR
jgi:glycosyltransferase involved in cell wall biosynthesis